MDLFIITTSVTLVLLSASIVMMFVTLNRSVVALTESLKRLQSEVSPMVSEVREGLQRFNQVTQVVRALASDLEAGRKAVKGGLELLTAPWLGKLKIFGKMLLAGASPQ